MRLHDELTCSTGMQVVYLIWAGYFRAGDSSFMGLQRQTGLPAGLSALLSLPCHARHHSTVAGQVSPNGLL